MSSIAPPEADARLESIEAITARSDERLKAIQYGVGQTNTTLKSMDGTLGRMDGKLDRIVELLEALPDRMVDPSAAGWTGALACPGRNSPSRSPLGHRSGPPSRRRWALA